MFRINNCFRGTKMNGVVGHKDYPKCLTENEWLLMSYNLRLFIFPLMYLNVTEAILARIIIHLTLFG